MLMLGREVTTPLTLMHATKEKRQCSDAPGYVGELVERMEKAHTCARQHLQQQQQRQKRDYDAKLFEKQYIRGDMVYEINSNRKAGISKKLAPVWRGPFVIEEVISPILLRVADRKGSRVVHHDRLKPCHDRLIPFWLRRKRNSILKSGCADGVNADRFIQPEGSTDMKYCICQGPDDGRMVITCDYCDSWYHCHCLAITPEEAQQMDIFICPNCKDK
ncbi:hypothetical protein BaRGS_00003734 [Batillaria attramentaria]|uniref:PHD-type domain-containing protein n=1 Tax=Batillaria attramentaria TaxID=370345 RepID=A0ABD0M1H5_9CAEN